jgi:transposase-like protein
MSNTKHKIPKDLKNQILERVKTSGKSIKEIANEHGISTNSIYTWLKDGVTGTTSKELIKLTKENRELKQIIGELTVALGTAQKKW